METIREYLRDYEADYRRRTRRPWRLRANKIRKKRIAKREFRKIRVTEIINRKIEHQILEIKSSG